MIATLLTLTIASADPMGAVVNQMVVVELERVAGIEVLAAADVDRVLAREQKRAVMGCEDAESCLAELADAMGARLVVYGDLSKVTGTWFLSLNLFDSESNTSVGRFLARGANVEELDAQIKASLTDKLFGSSTFPPGTSAMILQLKSATDDHEEPPPEDPPPEAGSGLLWVAGGAGLAALGLAMITPSVVVPLMVSAEQKSFSSDPAALGRAATLHDTWYGDSNLAPLGAIVGGVLVAAGVGVAVWGALE